jgi:NADH dehydrogenase [ubiquinone] 1 alpha subcomplex assembly factor 7
MAEERSPLESEIRRLIGIAGPMPVAEYMKLCLTHPQYGYYVTRNPIGAAGDFITAPEISQMFGELIGLWIASAWQAMNSPENVRVIELGPGRGTLMHDAMRAARIVKGFHDAVVLHLVEVGAALRQLQEQRLRGLGVATLWHNTLDDVPGGPSIIIANEYIDALPVHQAVKQTDGWHERVVEIGPGGDLVFGVARDVLPSFDMTLPYRLRQAPEGTICEWRTDSFAFDLARRARDDGAALIIDYGHVKSGLGETLQAVARHIFADPLRTPGRADLTAHVDFEALAVSAEGVSARVHGPVTQRQFLLNLGIEKRAAALKAGASQSQGATIDIARSRLLATGEQGMGELFKAMAISSPKLGPLPGFEAGS